MIIPMNKPVGWTSFDVVKKVRTITGEKRVGHGGTLDPFANGVLIVGVGSSTKLLSKFTNLEKEYIGILKLGEETDTLDIEGSVIKTMDVPTLTTKKIKRIFSSFIGEIEQIPPMYSAKKIEGKRLYTLARKNIVVDRKPVKIHIYSLDLLSYHKNNIKFQVTCSKGTYIRQLGLDIAKALGTVGYLVGLTRTKIGKYCLSDCYSLQDVEKVWLSTVT